MILKTLCFWLISLAASLSLAGERYSVVTLTPGQAMLDLGPHVEYLEDPEGTLSVHSMPAEALAWQSAEDEALNFGFTRSAYWVRVSLTIENEEDGRAVPYVLVLGNPILDWVDAYVYVDGTRLAHHAMGDKLPYTQRPIDYPGFAIPLEIHPGGNTDVYLRVRSDSSVVIPLFLYSNQKLAERSHERAVAQGLFYGAMLVMAIYNLLILFSIRDVSYLYYVMMVVSTAILLAGLEGITFKYLWPQASWLNDVVPIISLASLVAFAALFFRSFLALADSRPGLDRLALGFVAACVLAGIGVIFLPYQQMMMLVVLLAMGGIICGVWAGILRWLDGFHGANIFNLAWSCVLIAGFLLALIALGVLPFDWFSMPIMQIGAGLQAVLLSFAMAHRMSYERRMREEARQEATAAQQRMLEYQIETNESLDRIVLERTEALQRTNAKLKQISATDGLTQLLNRRAFDEHFLIEYRGALRSSSHIAVVMIDLDHFKSVNDNYGHPFGDLCLIGAAEVIRSNIRRPSDIAARYGGEEFILLLPDTDTRGAVCVAQRILDSLAQTVIDDGQQTLIISASIGVAACIPEEQNDQGALLKAADRQLYLAKNAGRNRVESEQAW